MRIPFNRASLSYESVEPYLREAIENGWLTTGPLTKRFTEGLAKYLNTENILALSSCTAALQIALKLADLPPGSEVILPSNTFVATLETVELAGLTPVLADIESGNWNICPESVREKISDRISALIAVPFAGAAPRMNELRAIADQKRIPLILDSAHALEARFEGRPLHEYADYTAFSFYATKNLTTAEGGALIVPPAMIERGRALSLHGMSRAAWNRYAGGSWQYDIIETGYKSNLTDIHSALGLAQLAKLNDNHTRRRALTARYKAALASLPIKMQESAASPEHAAHLFCLSVSESAHVTRDKIIETLKTQQIGFSVHFIPLYHLTSVKKYQRFHAKDFVENERYFQGALSLPLYPTLQDSEQEEIIDLIHSLFAGRAATLAG